VADSHQNTGTQGGERKLSKGMESCTERELAAVLPEKDALLRDLLGQSGEAIA